MKQLSRQASDASNGTHRLGASHCKMPLLGFLASATLATSIGRLMEGDAPVSPATRTHLQHRVGDDPDEPFSDNEGSDSENDGSPARFVHKLAKIPIPRRTARPTTAARSSPVTGAGGRQAVSKRKTNSPQLAQQKYC